MSPSRRTFLLAGGALAICPRILARASTAEPGFEVNDIHSQLNRTRVASIAQPASAQELRTLLRKARAETKSISIAGGRHAMGGQQFGADTVLIDTGALDCIHHFDAEQGIADVGGGMQWPRLIRFLEGAQRGRAQQWGIRQKQTGADRLTIGGALAANVHGRGLNLKPIINDVESFTLMNHEGELLHCDRKQNAELFRLAIGGYGLFGIVTSVRLRLAPRQKVERVVELGESKDLTRRFEERISAGFLYGDFQFATESNRDDFLRSGILACYRPVPLDTPIPVNRRQFSEETWKRLIYYAHTRKARAFRVYADGYLKTSGQIYWSDEHQLSYYADEYHGEVDRKTRARVRATEMITEIYVPRASLYEFLEASRTELRSRKANVIYGTIRLIERDEESFLAWARQPWACIIFNLHVTHDAAGIEAAAIAFRGLIDLAVRFGGSYYLTYHRWATHQQVLACYPQFPEFLRLKRRYDPDERFQSDWYRHYARMFDI